MENKIIDEFLPQETFKEIQNEILSSRFPFFITNKVNDYQTGENQFDWYATHTIYEDNVAKSSYYSKWGNIFLDRINQIAKVRALLRIKVNFYPNSKKLIEHAPHTDDEFTHIGAVIS